MLDSLLEGVAENQVRSAQHVAAMVARERKQRAGEPRSSDFNSKHPRGGKGTSQGGKFVRKGSSGTPVKRVQKRLGIAQTGSFAYGTLAAVRSFQRAHGLQVDGVVGAQTAQALFGNRNAKTVKPGALSAADAKALGVTAARPRTSKPRPKPKGKAPVRVGGGVVV